MSHDDRPVLSVYQALQNLRIQKEAGVDATTINSLAKKLLERAYQINVLDERDNFRRDVRSLMMAEDERLGWQDE